MKFKTVYWVIAAIIIAHVVLLVTGLYFQIHNLDVPMHILGGFAMGLFAIAIYSFVFSNFRVLPPLWFKFLFVVGFALLIGVAWEWHEFLIDLTITNRYGWEQSQLSISDTMWDFANDFIGAVIAFVIFRQKLSDTKKQNKILKRK
jgi:Na+-translocating ferredoxin:NAD+ oxidoreductase RnfA subunit